MLLYVKILHSQIMEVNMLLMFFIGCIGCGSKDEDSSVPVPEETAAPIQESEDTSSSEDTSEEESEDTSSES